MVSVRFRILLLIGCVYGFGGSVSSHEVPIHRAITDRAVDYLALADPTVGACAVHLKDRLGAGVEDEDDPYEPQDTYFPLGNFMFHFSPKLEDLFLTNLGVVATAHATCDSGTWGHTASTCSNSVGAGVSPRSSGSRSNAHHYAAMVAKLKALPGSSVHDEGLVSLGHYLHLLQDLTSPAHTRVDAHPHFESKGSSKYLGDPSLFELVNADRNVPMPGARSLKTWTTAEEGFIELQSFTSSRFWSERATLIGTNGPAKVSEKIGLLGEGYAYDVEDRPIAYRSSFLSRWTINDVLARVQFNELAPIAVLYTASMIKHIIEKEGVKLCPLTPTSFRYRAVMAPVSPMTGGFGLPACWQNYSVRGCSVMNAGGHILLRFHRPAEQGGGTAGTDYYIWEGSGLRLVNLSPDPTHSHLSNSREHRLDDDGRVLFIYGSSAVTYVWDRTSIRDLRTVLGTPPGTPPFFPPLRISSAGHAFTEVNVADGGNRVVRWDGLALRDLWFAAPGSVRVDATNKRGQACGRADVTLESTYGRAMFWDGEKVLELAIPFYCYDLNETGWAVGGCCGYELWRGGSDFVDLGSLGNERGSLGALALNDSGVVVGISAPKESVDRRAHGFLWSNGVIRDLNDLVDSGLEGGWVIEYAVDVNNAGQILVSAYKQNVGEAGVQQHVFRLDPIP